MREVKTPPHTQHELFGGVGTVAVWDLLGRASAPPFSAVLSCELEAKGVVGEHVQQRDAEIIVGLSGDGEAFVNGEAQPLIAGSVVYLAHGHSLSIHNRSETMALRYLIIKAKS